MFITGESTVEPTKYMLVPEMYTRLWSLPGVFTIGSLATPECIRKNLDSAVTIVNIYLKEGISFIKQIVGYLDRLMTCNRRN
jgi:hypothetical protein